MTKTKLFEPIQIGNLKLKNRVVMSPMIMYEAENNNGLLTPFHIVHYSARALGGVALINLEGHAILEDGRITEQDLGLWNDKQELALTDLVKQIHSFGSKIGIQLTHAGRKSELGKPLISSSAIAYNDILGVPKAMSQEEIKQSVKDYQTAAARANRAGFDVIELHLAHGYLINQFISPLVNKRLDEYGGSLENRYRFAHEVIQAMKSVFNGSFWVRISGDEYEEGGTTVEELIQIAKWLKEDGVDVIDVSSGGVVSKAPSKVYAGYQVSVATAIKQAVDIPVSVVGFLNEPKLGEFLLQTNQADLISLGRPLLANPNWLLQAATALRAQEDFKAYNDAYDRGRII